MLVLTNAHVITGMRAMAWNVPILTIARLMCAVLGAVVQTWACSHMSAYVMMDIQVAVWNQHVILTIRMTVLNLHVVLEAFVQTWACSHTSAYVMMDIQVVVWKQHAILTIRMIVHRHHVRMAAPARTWAFSTSHAVVLLDMEDLLAVKILTSAHLIHVFIVRALH